MESSLAFRPRRHLSPPLITDTSAANVSGFGMKSPGRLPSPDHRNDGIAPESGHNSVRTSSVAQRDRTVAVDILPTVYTDRWRCTEWGRTMRGRIRSRYDNPASLALSVFPDSLDLLFEALFGHLGKPGRPF